MANAGDYVRLQTPLEHFDGPCRVLRVLRNTRLVIQNEKGEVRLADQNEVNMAFEDQDNLIKRGNR